MTINDGLTIVTNYYVSLAWFLGCYEIRNSILVEIW